MRPKALTTFLETMLPAREPVLITGAPGIGKSDIVASAARSIGADLILSHPAVSDPTDVKGLPWIDKDSTSATFLPFGELAQAIRAVRPTVWFLDDLGQSAPAVQASYMQLLLARRVNGHALPECISFVAATNRRTDRAGVSGILEPVKSRFTGGIVELEAHIDDWSEWALSNGQPAEIVAFLRFRPGLLSDFKPSADLVNSPMPRTWAAAGRMLGRMPSALLMPGLTGVVGEGAAGEFMAFLSLYRELPSIDAILLDPSSTEIPTKPATLYAITTALGMRTNPKTFDRIAQYAQRLVESERGEFGVLLLRDAVRTCPAVTKTPAFVRVASGPLGQLISGQA